MGLQAAFVSADFHRVIPTASTTRPIPSARDEWSRPAAYLRLRFRQHDRRAGRSTAIFVLASLGSQA